MHVTINHAKSLITNGNSIMEINTVFFAPYFGTPVESDFIEYLDGFSENVREIIDKFKFRNQIPTMIKADILGAVIGKFMSSKINLSPEPVYEKDGKIIKLPGLDNHGMGTIFEELIRRFNEENNEEAGEHWTPRDVVELMSDLVFVLVADKIEDSTYVIYENCTTSLIRIQAA